MNEAAKNITGMRKFLSLMILVTVALFGGCGLTTCERSEIAMGTVVTLKATGSDAQAAVDESFARIAELEKNISADVQKIEDASGTGEGVKISPEVYEILEMAQKYSELTDGAFDVTCGVAVELWGIGTKNPRVPTDDEIAAVKNFVGHEHLHLHDSTAYLDLRGVKLNLGGVAKGYGVDLARKIFAAHGIHDGLIDFGNSTIFAIGKKKIGIKNPNDPGKLAEIVEIENCAISTSGDYEKFFIVEGHRYSHIIDPKTCAPADSGISSISVIVSNDVKNCATVSDILSTTFFITDRHRTKEILRCACAIKLGTADKSFSQRKMEAKRTKEKTISHFNL